ncbi:MAG: hypothetical protein JNG89_09575 [Planctomycetaceae bacterium]|nr:hypothetical protein [Planctomycetaceae bacterium]
MNRVAGDMVLTPETADLRRRVETYVSEHPAVCIAAALTMGAIVGWLIKRR